MSTAIQLSKMSRAQKLKVMEDIWADLTHEETKFKSPSWHAAALLETEEGIQAGKVKFTDWERVKRNLR
jgi:hypothetical protein